MVAMKVFIWICVFYTLAETKEKEILNATACFSGDNCNTYELKCPQSQKIRLMEAEYRYKFNTTCNINPCNNANSCCYFDETDCKGTYSPLQAQALYQRCSGMPQCESNRGVQGDFVNCSHVLEPGRRYIRVKYTCIYEKEVIDMCYSPTRKNLAEVNIMLFNKTLSTNVSSECKCFVESQRNVSYELVDIRFFTSTDSSERHTCTSGNLTINGLSIQCRSDNKEFIYEGSDKFNGQIHGNSEIKLTYFQFYIPAMVWIYLKASSNEDFTIHCVNNSTPPTVTTSASKMNTTSSKADTTIGESEDGNSLPTIIGVVVAVIIVIAVVAVALIIFKRRQKKRTEDDTHISGLPNVLMNHTYESSKEVYESNAVVETSNYDTINDDSVLTYSRPIKEKRNTRGTPECPKNYGDVSADEYDRIEFEMKGASKATNYDSLPAPEGKIGDDTYSHVSNQLKSVTTTGASASEYSRCKLNSKDTLRNDDDYSHVERDCKKHQQSKTNGEDSYNHIDFEETKHPMRNGKAVIDENKSDSENNSPTCTYVKSRDMETENYPLDNGDTGLSSKNTQHQGTKAVLLRDNNTELAARSKDQQYTAVVKVEKGKQSNAIDGGAKENLDSKRPNVLLNTLSNSDYELAKPTDL